MRGFFGIGIEAASKEGNIGNLIRTAHAFGAAFAFAVAPKIRRDTGEPVTAEFTNRHTAHDTSKSWQQLPFYSFDTLGEVPMPQGCQLVGVEMTDDSIDLPEFRHPAQAVYLLGGERTSLSPEALERCDALIRVPTAFSLNVATAGAIVMYDRLRVLGGFKDRPLMAGQTAAEREAHVHGGRMVRAEGRKVTVGRTLVPRSKT